MAKVTLFFKAINKDEHLVSSFLPRECGHMPTTVKRPVGRLRKRKPSAEAPPVPNIDRASEIWRTEVQFLPRALSPLSPRQSTRMPIKHALRILITQISAPHIGTYYLRSNTRCPLALDFGGAYIRNNTVVLLKV